MKGIGPPRGPGGRGKNGFCRGPVVSVRTCPVPCPALYPTPQPVHLPYVLVPSPVLTCVLPYFLPCILTCVLPCVLPSIRSWFLPHILPHLPPCLFAHALPSVLPCALPHDHPTLCPTSQATKGPAPSRTRFPGNSPHCPRLGSAPPPGPPVGAGVPPRAHPSCAAEAGRLLNKLIRSGRGAGAERGPTVGLLEL